MEREIDRQIGAVSAEMWTLYQTVVVKRELSPEGKAFSIPVDQPSPMVMSFGLWLTE